MLEIVDVKLTMKLSALGIINALGSSKSEVFKNACSGNQNKLKKIDNIIPNKSAYFGIVSEELPSIRSSSFNFRTNRLLLHCFLQIENEWINITSKYPSSRIGIILGTNNTGLDKFDNDINSYFKDCNNDLNTKLLEYGSVSDFLQSVTKTHGIAYVISTACSASAKAFAVAKNLINQDICDAVLVGGSDDLCSFTVRGFNALEAYSLGITNPFSKNRDGINIGEGAALFILEKDNEGIEVLGVGESSDAYHITSPDPMGTGAKQSMLAALRDASLASEDISYINLHGTGTLQNDSMEHIAVKEIFGNDIICASTKPLTGHLMGAAGVTEVALCWLMLSDLNTEHFLIPHIYDGCDMENSLTFAKVNQQQKIKYCISNSFAFGGSNASVIIGNKNF